MIYLSLIDINISYRKTDVNRIARKKRDYFFLPNSPSATPKHKPSDIPRARLSNMIPKAIPKHRPSDNVTVLLFSFSGLSGVSASPGIPACLS
jgi:hypothetical protein